REYRLYYVERVFDYSAILSAYVRNNQEIVCSNCSEKFDLEKLEALRLFGMQCPSCKSGRCKVVNLSRKYEEILQSIDPELLLPRTELGILQSLYTEGKPLNATEIAEDLDCSYQLVGRRSKMLDDRGLIDRTDPEAGRRQYELTESARRSYFSGTEEAGLDIE